MNFITNEDNFENLGTVERERERDTYSLLNMESN